MWEFIICLLLCILHPKCMSIWIMIILCFAFRIRAKYWCFWWSERISCICITWAAIAVLFEIKMWQFRICFKERLVLVWNLYGLLALWSTYCWLRISHGIMSLYLWKLGDQWLLTDLFLNAVISRILACGDLLLNKLRTTVIWNFGLVRTFDSS